MKEYKLAISIITCKVSTFSITHPLETEICVGIFPLFSSHFQLNTLNRLQPII